jgi:hypothetical protein
MIDIEYPDYQLNSKESSVAAAQIHFQQIKLPSNPTFEAPDIPSDITELSDEELMELYSQLVAYSNYITVQLAVAEVDEKMQEKAIARKQAEKMGTVSEKTVAAAKAKVASDQEVVALLEALDSLYSYRKLVEAVHQNLDRNVSLVSRELTRRTSKTSTGKRWN